MDLHLRWLYNYCWIKLTIFSGDSFRTTGPTKKLFRLRNDVKAKRFLFSFVRNSGTGAEHILKVNHGMLYKSFAENEKIAIQKISVSASST